MYDMTMVEGSGPAAMHDLADTMTHLVGMLGPDGAGLSLGSVVSAAVARIPGSACASISVRRGRHFRTAAASDTRAARADAIQHEVGFLPSPEADHESTVRAPSDLRRNHRWPEFHHRVWHELGLADLVSYRLGWSPDGSVGRLNVYSTDREAFDDRAISLGLLIATHGAVAMSAALSLERERNLQRALDSSRDIGAAIGILMAQRRLSRAEAFDVLRVASQHTNRRLRDIALEVVDTGVLRVPAPAAEARAEAERLA